MVGSHREDNREKRIKYLTSIFINANFFEKVMEST
jgi:hypothetical protein